MNLEDAKYEKFGLVRDMLATPELVARFDAERARTVADRVRSRERLLLTGEGSSRIFPAKHAIMRSRRHGDQIVTHTEAGLQSRDYKLADWVVLAASNSGRTSEVVRLFDQLRSQGHEDLYSLTAFADSKLEAMAHSGVVLECGPEGAVAATKSVVEQALYCQSVVDLAAGRHLPSELLQSLAATMRHALTVDIDPAITAALASAKTIYFAGKNDGVAEELALKTNEITRKRSGFLEGTYSVHGIEEVMDADEVVVWVDPMADSEAKFKEVLVDGVGMKVIAISDRETSFPTLRVPQHELSSYVLLAAGWSLLVEAGVALGVDIDKPVRARKVGNDFVG